MKRVKEIKEQTKNNGQNGGLEEGRKIIVEKEAKIKIEESN